MDLEVDEATRVAGHVGLRIIVGKERVKARVVHKEFRGFETLLRNRLLEEAPLYASRVCGICQVSHALASVEAIEDGLGIGVPFEAKKLREVANLAGTVQSHLLHLFLLIAPSCLKAVAAAPTGRPDITGIARLVVEGRGIAQKIVQEICGRSIHPVTVVPGGFSKPVSAEQVSKVSSLADRLSEVLEAVSEGFAPILDDEYSERGVSLRTNYMYALDGRIVVKDRDGSELFSFGKKEYEGYIGEAEAEEGYGTSPYLKAAGALGAPFRVGPLARLNASAGKEAGTLWAEARHESVMYTRARIVECLLASRRMGESAAELESGVGASPAELGFKEGEGFGVVEAPRGTLLHHYAFDRNGIVMKANVITPTAFNSPAIERDIEENVKQIGTEDVGRLKERAVKVLRDYDPCIPCATHQVEVLVG